MDDNPIPPSSERRDIRWHLTRLLASYAIGLLVFLLGVAVGPFVAGPAFLQLWVERIGGYVMLGVTIAALPLVYRRLR